MEAGSRTAFVLMPFSSDYDQTYEQIIRVALIAASCTTSSRASRRQTSSSPSILIAQGIERVPFDLESYRVITYSRDLTKINALGDGCVKWRPRATR